MMYSVIINTDRSMKSNFVLQRLLCISITTTTDWLFGYDTLPWLRFHHLTIPDILCQLSQYVLLNQHSSSRLREFCGHFVDKQLAACANQSVTQLAMALVTDVCMKRTVIVSCINDVLYFLWHWIICASYLSDITLPPTGTHLIQPFQGVQH